MSSILVLIIFRENHVQDVRFQLMLPEIGLLLFQHGQQRADANRQCRCLFRSQFVRVLRMAFFVTSGRVESIPAANLVELGQILGGRNNFVEFFGKLQIGAKQFSRVFILQLQITAVHIRVFVNAAS